MDPKGVAVQIGNLRLTLTCLFKFCDTGVETGREEKVRK